jgi:hypothetical protein
MKPKSLSTKTALSAMQRGASLVLMHDNAVPGGLSWCVLPGGRVSNEIARRIIVRGDVVSAEDGLLPGHSQTYRMLAFVDRK